MIFQICMGGASTWHSAQSVRLCSSRFRVRTPVVGSTVALGIATPYPGRRGGASTWHSGQKRPPLKLEVSGSSPRGWFNSRAGNRDPFRWLETARGLSPIRLIGRAQCFPGGLAASSLKRVSISHPFAVSAMKHSGFFSCPGEAV